MANNRLWLVYRPTGKAVFLGKRMAVGWYFVPDDVGARIEALFAHLEEVQAGSQDDLMLAMEECEADTPFVSTDWRYAGATTLPLNTLELGPDPDVINSA
jgi:hypothetical protein